MVEIGSVNLEQNHFKKFSKYFHFSLFSPKGDGSNNLFEVNLVVLNKICLKIVLWFLRFEVVNVIVLFNHKFDHSN